MNWDVIIRYILPIASCVGVPALCSALVLGISKRIGDQARRAETERRAQEEETKAIRLGVQAMLRAQMIHEYNKAKDKGYAPIYAKENFENVYANYHALGVNGVMDSIKDEYMEMPTRKEDVVHDQLEGKI